jgi:elongation factor P
MAVLDYSEVKPKKCIIYDDEPYEVLESHVSRTQKRKPQNAVKLRNLISGRVIPVSFHASDTVDEAEVFRKKSRYLYTSKGEHWFCDPKNPGERYILGTDVVGDDMKWLKENTEVDLRTWGEDEDERIIGMTIPVKMTLEVKDAPPATKGNTASGGDKLVTLETGAQVTTPLFIEVGEKIVVNTETGEYVERA